ncbi:hypothetical protein RN001_004960 [Aquatica leii]|uniref:Uncharacterized protein n=1 Tax=Aquatica leii TaxID=1421715 RepID=A0AAN7SAB9_9COLE|nr:hypothetical protein RN001_004960 [Aquatica leii]
MQDHTDCDINKKMDHAETFLLNAQNYSEDQRKQVKHKLSNLKSEIKQTIRRKMTSEELSFATHVKLLSEGKADASNLIRNLSKSPNRAKKYRKALIERQKEQIQQLTPVEALSMFVEAGLCRKHYPCYTILQNVKKDCYPVQESYRITATCAEVNLQDVLHHTASRLLLSLTEVVQHSSDEERETLTLMYKFFADHELSASITGIDSGLIYSFKVILEAVSSGHKIDTTKFELFCSDTAKLYVELYLWHPMTPTLHKILFHGPFIIEKALLPIGMMSEEAAEARNKHFRLYRQNYARKFSREPTPRKTTKPFLKETIEMLLPAETPNQSDSSDDQDLGEETVESSDEPWMSSSE